LHYFPAAVKLMGGRYTRSEGEERTVAHEAAEVQDRAKRAFLVSAPMVSERRSGGKGPGERRIGETASLARELEGLARSLGLEIIAHEVLNVRGRSPHYGMGTGKAQELAEKAAELGADCMIFDWDPSPSQQRNWETLTGIPVVDRQELIIEIFADRASTREAELQVRLAELSYALPRLAHKYIDLSRQRGGRYGTRGSGETRLELDRRQVEQRIRRLEEELEEVRRQRQVQRRQRERQGIPICALVGYTNAGKSSLMNALTGADLAVEDKLFVTLDAASRRFELAPGLPLLLVDTVGFIRNLPHTLVDAFHSTLEEAALADLLIHVVDASDPDLESCYRTTLQVLEDLGAADIPRITVLNKMDKREPPADSATPAGYDHEGGSLPPRSIKTPAFFPVGAFAEPQKAENTHQAGVCYSASPLCGGPEQSPGCPNNPGAPATPPDSLPPDLTAIPGAIPLSVRRGWGLEELKERMRKSLTGTTVRFRFPPDRGDLVGQVYRAAQVLRESWEDDGIVVEARTDEKLIGQLRRYLIC
jgi:GTP-binding protein HflX